MSKGITKELILEGLDCAHCSAQIEEKVSTLKNVKTASVNFVTKTLTIETENSEAMETVLDQAKEVIGKIEPLVVISEKIINKTEKKVLLLMGLCCGNCAAKIEHETKNLAGVKHASVDFISRKLVIEAASKREMAVILDEAKKIVQRIEPAVTIVIEDEGKPKSLERESEREAEESRADAARKKAKTIRLSIGVALFAVVTLLDLTYWTEFGIYLTAYLLIGYEVLVKSARNIARGQVFDENFLMAIATMGAFAIGAFSEGVAVMLFYEVGEFFQSIAVNRSRRSIKALMDIRPDFANLKVGDDTQRVSPEDVEVGDLIIVKPGERVPLDGVVLEGQSMLDTSALTGESLPRDVQAGSDVLSGSINKNGVLVVEVTKEFGESTVSKILDLVQNASSKKAPTEQFITKFARYYTPGVVVIATALAIIPPLVLPGAVFSDWLYRALVFLVVSCPCALVISIPLGFFGGIGAASKSGILIKGSNYLEALNSVEVVVFDKTGTLTKGVFKVTEIKPVGISSEELLEYAAYAESYSTHPIATSILKAYQKDVAKGDVESYDELSGHGIKVRVKGKDVLAGNTRLMNKEGIIFETPDVIGSIVYVAVDGSYAGYIVISDEVKDDSAAAIRELKAIGIRKTVMLTGDVEAVGQRVGKQLGLDQVFSDLLPDQKVERLEALEAEKSPKGKLIFVGDGINDAPVLARADIGIAMGGVGSDAAIEAADIVIMTDEPSKIVTAIRIAKRTRSIVVQNIVMALVIKGVVLVLGAGGMATMWEAVFADMGVAIAAILNAMRVMKSEDRHQPTEPLRNTQEVAAGKSF